MGSQTTLGEAHVPIRATMDQLDKDLSSARSKISSAVDGITNNLQVIGISMMASIGAAMGIITGGLVALTKFTIDAAPIEGVAKAFDGLTDSAGVSGDAMLEALQKGSYGMITNADLMKSYNQAAQLVGLEFANNLPNAIQYLSKVSASTGQDMGFMMDSLVKGVGRLSPMILDNLGIQVSLSEATAKAAEMYGVEEAELSKAQVQAGMMNVVLEKLEANTAAMPDITDLAATKMAQFKVDIQNAKDSIGMAFLPTLSTVMETLSNLADKIMPVVTKALDKFAPIIENIAESFGKFVLSIASGESPLDAFKTLMQDILPEGMAEKVTGFVDKIVEFVDKVKEVLDPVTKWVSENVKLQDVLIALGIALATVVVPAIISFVTAAAPIIGTFLAVLAVIALVRAAWESDFLGMRTALTDAWENTIKPAFEELWNWLSVNIPAAIDAVKTWWENVFMPVLEVVWGFIQDNIIPVFQALGNLLSVVIGGAISVLAALWQNILLPAIMVVWNFLSTYVFPLFIAIGEFLGAVFGLAIKVLAGLWQNVLAPALQVVFGWLAEKLQPAFEVLIDVISVFKEWLAAKLRPALDAIGAAIGRVTEFIGKMTEMIKKVRLPDWLTPGSPTPFEIGLLGIGDALQNLNTMHLPKFKAALEINESGMMGLAGGMSGASAAQANTGISSAELQLALQNQARFMATAMATAVAQRMG